MLCSIAVVGSSTERGKTRAYELAKVDAVEGHDLLPTAAVFADQVSP